MQSDAKSVEKYLAELPPERREVLQAVRNVILKNLDKNYEEGMLYGMIGYYVPHRVFPDGYHCDPSKPLSFASLASRKEHMSLGIMSNYGDSPEEKWFKAAWAKTGKKLDMGACCVRFKKVEDLALDVVGESIRRMPADRFIEVYQAARQTNAASSRSAKPISVAKSKAKASGGRNPRGKKKPTAKSTSAKKPARPKR